jgi:ribosomal-protein-alanine N-acetyltransferase
LKINNIAIRKEYRRMGLGRWLMEYVLDLGFRKGCDSAGLEVRGSNEAAIQMYRKLGFKISGMKKRYYSDNGEDALLMMLNLNEYMIRLQKEGPVTKSG